MRTWAYTEGRPGDNREKMAIYLQASMKGLRCRTQISILQNRGKINVCCLSHLVCGTLLWQLQQTNKHKNIIRQFTFFPFFFDMKSSKSSVYFTLKAYFNLDQPQFKCSVTMVVTSPDSVDTACCHYCQSLSRVRLLISKRLGLLFKNHNHSTIVTPKYLIRIA